MTTPCDSSLRDKLLSVRTGSAVLFRRLAMLAAVMMIGLVFVGPSVAQSLGSQDAEQRRAYLQQQRAERDEWNAPAPQQTAPQQQVQQQVQQPQQQRHAQAQQPYDPYAQYRAQQQQQPAQPAPYDPYAHYRQPQQQPAQPQQQPAYDPYDPYTLSGPQAQPRPAPQAQQRPAPQVQPAPQQVQQRPAAQPAPQAQPAPAAAPSVAPAGKDEYRLGSSDAMRITVFGHKDLSGDFAIDGSGYISMPLVQRIYAKGLTTRQLEQSIQQALSPDYLRNPRVAVEVLNYRPFFILGEVANKGRYEYAEGMTVINAIALAGGFTYRANKDKISIKRYNSGEEERVKNNTIVLPGDVITVPERFF